MNSPRSELRPFVAAALAVLVAVACSTAKQEVVTPNPQFHWEPPAQDPPRTISLALLNPKPSPDGNTRQFESNQYFKAFLKAIHDDLNRALLAKGFTVAEFPSLDDMTFPDKKASPLALETDIEIITNLTKDVDQSAPGTLGSQSVKMSGTLAANINVKFTMKEPLSDQKIWLKRVEVPQQTAPFEVDILKDSHGRNNPYHNNRDNREAASVAMLNQAFPVIMNKFWNYLNGDEIQMMKKAADDARARKVY